VLFHAGHDSPLYRKFISHRVDHARQHTRTHLVALTDKAYTADSSCDMANLICASIFCISSRVAMIPPDMRQSWPPIRLLSMTFFGINTRGFYAF